MEAKQFQGENSRRSPQSHEEMSILAKDLCSPNPVSGCTHLWLGISLKTGQVVVLAPGAFPDHADTFLILNSCKFHECIQSPLPLM